MYRIKTILLLLPLLSLLSCKDCDECFSPPAPLLFEIRTADGQNIFNSETISLQEINILNNDAEPIDFALTNIDSLIEINAVGGASEQVKLTFEFQNYSNFTFSISAERVTEDCCSFTRFSNPSVAGATLMESSGGKYSIRLQE